VAQDDARKALYLAAVEDEGPSDEVLAQMVHALCDLLLCAEIPLKKVFGPVEISFCLFMKNKEGRYQPIDHLTAFFAVMQWCLRIILAHKICLQSNGSPSYIPYTPPIILFPPQTPPHSAEPVPGLVGALEKNHLKKAISSPLLIEVAHEDELDTYLDSLDHPDNPGGDSIPESSRDSEEVMDQETIALELGDLSLVGDKILLQNSEGLLKWVNLISLFPQ